MRIELQVTIFNATEQLRYRLQREKGLKHNE